MSDHDRSPMQAEFMRPHVKAANPHPQYVLATALPAATAVASAVLPQTERVGDAGQVGTSTTASREDHRHPMPGTATQGSSGFMSASDKVALDNSAAAIGLAQANASAALVLATSVQAQANAQGVRIAALENAAPVSAGSIATTAAALIDLERRFRTLLLAYTNAGLPFPPALAADLVAASNQ